MQVWRCIRHTPGVLLISLLTDLANQIFSYSPLQHSTETNITNNLKIRSLSHPQRFHRQSTFVCQYLHKDLHIIGPTFSDLCERLCFSEFCRCMHLKHASLLSGRQTELGWPWLTAITLSQWVRVGWACRQRGQGTALCQADDKGGWSNWHSVESSVAKAGVSRQRILTGCHGAELKQSINIQEGEMSGKCTPPPYIRTHLYHI